MFRKKLYMGECENSVVHSSALSWGGVWIQGMEITGLVWIAMKFIKNWHPNGATRRLIPATHPGRSSPVNTGIIFKCVHHLPNNRISLLLLLYLRLIVVTNINNAWAFTMEGPLSASFAITTERRQKSMSG